MNISVVVLASPNEAPVGFNGISDHVVDESVLVPHSVGLEVLLVVRIVNFLENVLESAIVLLHDGVLGAHVKRVVSLLGVLE